MAPRSEPDNWINSKENVKVTQSEDILSSAALSSEQNLGTDLTKWDIAWSFVIGLLLFHIGALYGIYLVFTVAKWQTVAFVIFLYIISGLGVTAGAHRLWSHKSYKAKLPLRIILVSFFTMSYQLTVLWWVKIHRTHHKYSDTDADPHNAERGFFYSHIGWLLLRKHPHVRAQKIDISDLKEDPVLRFQHKYYLPLLLPLLCFIVPTYVPVLWGESPWSAFYVCVCLRFICTIHVSALVNSAAHLWGNKPYDKDIRPADNSILSFFAGGEGFHNYHHIFPWDYRTAELGGYSLNFTKLFIDTMASIGWAYDLKTVPREVLEARVKRTGDGSHTVWGWDDSDLSVDDRKTAIINFTQVTQQ